MPYTFQSFLAFRVEFTFVRVQEKYYCKMLKMSEITANKRTRSQT